MKFSVVIPLYNKVPYVAKAIQSVLAQTFTDYELIVMDDGSRDGSFEVAKSTIENHSNCHLYRQQNAGVSVARNAGAALSQGAYLCFLDADDWWEPTFLEETSRLVEEFPDAGIFGTNYTIVNETKHKTRVASIGVEAGFEKGYINYCRVYAKTLAMPLTSISVAIPRRVFNEMGGFPKGVKLGEDFLLWIHIALKYKVVFMNKPLAYYNQDVDKANRSVGRLYNPKENMLRNLTDLEPLEGENMDYKDLVDVLRVDGLMAYYLCDNFRDVTRLELSKVDWTKQPKKKIRLYQRPVVWLKFRNRVLKLGSRIKTLLKRYRFL